MSMTTGGGGSYSSDINVTPMIDILLVLLIIFMVIVPVTPKGLDALVPQPPKDPTKAPQNIDRTIVVQVLYRPGQSPAYKINDTDVDKRELLPRLTEIYANRAERIMFVKGDDNVNFAYIAEVIDIGGAANVDHIGLLTRKFLAGESPAASGRLSLERGSPRQQPTPSARCAGSAGPMMHKVQAGQGGLGRMYAPVCPGVASAIRRRFIQVETGVQFFHPGFGYSRPRPAAKKSQARNR
ncbi:MAG: biopolymer transporter ExbD [Terracidiphilus sp.]